MLNDNLLTNKDPQAPPINTMPEEYFDLKARIHDRLLDIIDLSVIDKLERNDLEFQIRQVIERIFKEESFTLPLNLNEREKIFTEILDEILAYGPLEPLLKDHTVSDILVNTYKDIYVERAGKIETTDARFKDDEHLMRIIDKIVSSVGRRIDESSPMVDARLPDGFACERHYPSPGFGRADSLHPAVCGQPIGAGRSDRLPNADTRNRRPTQGNCQVPFERRHIRWDRQRKNHPLERVVAVHSGRRAHHNHRRCRGTADEAGACGPARNPAAEY